MMRYISMTSLALGVLLGACINTSYAQQPPVITVDTTQAALPMDSAAVHMDSSVAQPTNSAPAPAPVAAPVAAPAATQAAPPPATAAPPAQATPTAAAPPPASAEKKKRHLYYGATLGLTFFGDVTRFYVQPMVGVPLTPRISVGGKLGYEHLKFDNIQGDDTQDNWGASVFSRLKILPMLYGHAEYAIWSYDTGNDRTSVPYLLLGGGYIKPLGRNMALTVEALFDVLQDENSPYNDWEPWVTVGVQIGF